MPRHSATSWSHVNQVLASIQLTPRATAREIGYSRLIESGVDVQRSLDQLVRSGRVNEQREEYGPPSYTLADSTRKVFVPVDGDGTASRVLRFIKQDPGQSARAIGKGLGYANPGGAVGAALARLIGTGQVRRVVTPNGNRHYATGADK